MNRTLLNVGEVSAALFAVAGAMLLLRAVEIPMSETTAGLVFLGVSVGLMVAVRYFQRTD